MFDKNRTTRFLNESDRTQLSFTNSGVEYEDVIFLVEELNKHSNVSILVIHRDNLDYACAAKLAELRYVTELNLSHNDISARGAIALLQNPHFEKLDLSNNGFRNPQQQPCLVEAIKNNHTLVELKITRSGISKENMQEIENHFKKLEAAKLNGHTSEAVSTGSLASFSSNACALFNANNPPASPETKVMPPEQSKPSKVNLSCGGLCH